MKNGFNHWLGVKTLAEAANDEFLLSIYPALRMGEPEARKLVIKRHIRLVFGFCRNFSKTYWDTDELVSEGLYSLVDGVDKIIKGAIDHHSPQPNISGYLRVSIYGSLSKLVTRKLGVNEKTYRKHNGNTPRLILSDSQSWIQDTRNPEKNAEYNELMGILEDKMRNRESEVLDLRLQGFNDVEIGQRLGVTSARIFQIRQEIKSKLERII